MSYELFWRSPALPYVQKQNSISVPTASVVSNACSLRLTGRGASNYGKIQQENFLRLLENHAGPTEPAYPTVGQTWFDTSVGLLKVATATPPLSTSPTADWRAMNATYVTNVGEQPPSNPVLGDSWFKRTGSMSGQLYVYDKIGRYPAVDWNARTAGLHPAVSVSAGIKINYGTFSTQNYGEAYIHGFSAGTAADVDGTILNSELGTIVLPKGGLSTNLPGKHYIVFDNTGNTLVSATDPTARYFTVRKVGFDAFEYDNNLDWVQVPTLTANSILVIGTIDVAEEDDNTAPGINSAELWDTGIWLYRAAMLTGNTETTKAGGSIGGWSQVWPQVETLAGRAEYEEMYNTLMYLIGSPVTYGGSNAVGKSVKFLTDFSSLDASLLATLFTAGNALDPNVSAPGISGIPARVQPNSQDWDRLLAAARYAVNRLELPVASTTDISPIPFVQDGLPLPADLITLTETGSPLDPGVERRYPSRKRGVASLMSLYSQTVNLLDAAVQNRYMMRGILGNSGTNTSFPSTVQITSQQRFQAPGSIFSGSPTTHGLQFKFNTTSTPNSNLHLKEFFTSAQAIQLNILYSTVATANDTNFANLVSNVGQIRILADQVLIMSSGTQQLTQAPIAGGFLSLTSSSSTLATLVGTGCSITLRGQLTGQGNVTFFIDVTTAGALTSALEVQWKYIEDTETYANPAATRVYPTPIAFDPAHRQGSTSFSALGT